jgi:nucleotide-binding universal stress UspA family protein
MLKNILVAYDGSESADRAFEFALELAKPFGASVTVLSVARPPEPATMVETEAILESATEHFEAHFRTLREKARKAGMEITTLVVVGHPAEQIVHAADQQAMDMIVMGHRGKSMIEKWLLGSVSKRVLSYAPCKVLIVR